MHILNHLESDISDFRPRNARQFVALQLARHFSDLARLSKYLIAAHTHPRRTLLAAAKTARMRSQLNRAPITELFFEVLEEVRPEAPL